MKILLYILILCAVVLIPVRGTDVGKLIPVEVIAISESRGMFNVNTDTGDSGHGKTLEDAFEDLENTSPGVIYLDTAEYLLLETGLDPQELAGRLKENMKVYQAAAGIPLEGIGKYLSINPSDVKLKNIENKRQLPVVTEENGRYSIIK